MDTGVSKERVAGRLRLVRALIAIGTATFMANAAPPVCNFAVPLAFAETASSQPPFVPGSFELQGSNGYSIYVVAIPASGGRGSAVGIWALGHRMGVSYSAPATVTETSIQANLGELGEISVTFHRSDEPTTTDPKCGRTVSIESGSFEGRIDFHGEEGYTEAQAISVPASIDFLLDGACGGFVTSGGGNPFSPGAELYIRNPALGPRLSVVKARPSAAARFHVSDSGYHNGISIERFATLVLPPESFKYSSRLQTATIRPPAPFSGTAHFDRHKSANRRWSGDLTIDMPGHADLPLTGRQLRASLVRP